MRGRSELSISLSVRLCDWLFAQLGLGLRLVDHWAYFQDLVVSVGLVVRPGGAVMYVVDAVWV